MLLIKVGGSLLAPKDKKGIDFNYLKNIFSFLKEFNNIFLVHGTGNIGHGYVKNLLKDNPLKDLNELLVKDFENGQKILNCYFSKIDDTFFYFKRIKVEDFLKENKKKFNKGKFIIGGDILKSGKIISSDDIFSILLKEDYISKIIILTDVDGVFDENGNIIPIITETNFQDIKFWEKKNDVTGSMKEKVKKMLGNKKGVFICNGNDLENVKSYLLTGKGRGTVIF